MKYILSAAYCILMLPVVSSAMCSRIALAPLNEHCTNAQFDAAEKYLLTYMPYLMSIQTYKRVKREQTEDGREIITRIGPKDSRHYKSK